MQVVDVLQCKFTLNHVHFGESQGFPQSAQTGPAVVLGGKRPGFELYV